MKTRHIETLKVQHVYSVQEDVDYYEVLADGEIIADLAATDGEVRLTLFAGSANLELVATDFSVALERAIAALHGDDGTS